MRLINTTTLELQDFTLTTIPPYAILSHTWGSDEVSFQDISSPDVSSKKGYMKIEQSCRLAREHGLGLAWVDTCCIDKTSSAELTESINSMFRWYRDAAVCYVYLEDLEPDAELEYALPHCRWFTRGWTLQELVAPENVVFYDMAWNKRGTKIAMSIFLEKLTKIESGVLRHPKTLHERAVARRMTWAANRKTTRIEDTAYCLLGIFDVNMPLIYGEGMKAFRRLQEEIIKSSPDLTIFAWQGSKNYMLGLFASSPNPFFDCGYNVGRFSLSPANYTVTNQGLLVSGTNCLALSTVRLDDGGYAIRYIFFFSGAGYRFLGKSGIYLRKLGPKTFYRDGELPPIRNTDRIENSKLLMLNTAEFYILSDPIDIFTLQVAMFKYRAETIHVPKSDHFSLEAAVPEDLWDASDRVFLSTLPHSSDEFSIVLAMRFKCTFRLTSFEMIALCDLCDSEKGHPTCKLFKRGDYANLEALFFVGRNRNEQMYWHDVLKEFPEVSDLEDDCVNIRVDDAIFHITVTFNTEPIGGLPGPSERTRALFSESEDKWYRMDFAVLRGAQWLY